MTEKRLVSEVDVMPVFCQKNCLTFNGADRTAA